MLILLGVILYCVIGYLVAKLFIKRYHVYGAEIPIAFLFPVALIGLVFGYLTEIILKEKE